MKKMISTEERELLSRNLYEVYNLIITEDMWNEYEQAYEVVFDKFVPATFYVLTDKASLKHPEGMLRIKGPFSVIVNGKNDSTIYADYCMPQRWTSEGYVLGEVNISGGLSGDNNYYMLIGQALFFNFFAHTDL